MEKEKYAAIPAITDTSFKQRQLSHINSLVFMTYLDNSIKDCHPEQFANTLQLPLLAPYIESLRLSSNINYFYTEEERQKLLAPEAEGTDYLEALGNRVEREKKQRKANKKAQGEQHALLYFDPHNEEYLATSPIKGTYYRTYFDAEAYFSLLENDKVPLLEMHTHPDESLFSPIDFFRIITQLAPRMRTLKGSLVISPNSSIIALATSHTPKLSLQEAEAYTHASDEELAMLLEQVGETYRTQRPVLKEYGIRLKELDDEFDKVIKPYTDQLKEMQDKYRLTDDEIVHAILAIATQQMPAQMREYDELQKKQKPLKEELKAILHVHTNNYLVECARELHLKLYRSIDDNTFKAFSA